MKRVISAITVTVILCSATAIPSKKCQYCIATTSGGNCMIMSAITETNTGTPPIIRYKYTNWDGTPASCFNGNCNTQTTFYNCPSEN